MDETANSINKKTSISLSRNSPVALIVGAGSFIGSSLTDELLRKGIQVIGLDDLEAGEKSNLREAAENKDFHLLIESPERVDLELSRLDYLFIIPQLKWNLGKILELFKNKKCRCLLVSSIDLYDKQHKEEKVGELRELEVEVAKYADIHKLNARILRLGAVFGPRMNFDSRDPLIKLIQQSLSGDLQSEISLEFSSRALYISDTVDLIIKTIFAGSTAQKIFDGVLPVPIKISEVKQVLLDPIWYESRGFVSTELPPWPTPNLDKTIKFLNWHPQSKLVTSLRKTLQFFKDNEISVPKPEAKQLREEEEKEIKLDDKRKKELELFKQSGQRGTEEQKKSRGALFPRFSLPLSKIYLGVVIALITYAFLWPIFSVGWGIFTFRSELNEGFKNLQRGDFEKSLINIESAQKSVEVVKDVIDSLEPLRRLGWFKSQLVLSDNLVDLAYLSADSAKNTVLGTRNLLQSLRAVTGELTEAPSKYFDSAKTELNLAEEDISKANAILKDDNFKRNIPKNFISQIDSLSGKVASYTNLVSKAQAISILLPEMVAIEGSKSYLVLLQNNMELRPGGGFIGSFAKVSFEGGKLKNLDVNDIYAIDGNLNIQVEPPKEIKEDLGQKYWFLRDSNWESDFPTSARQAEWFYTKETGERVEGVVALDVSAIEELLGAIGPLDLADYNEKITADNLFEKAISHAELSFFPGSQAKKSFITALTNQLFNKIFFLPQNNWAGIIAALGKGLDEKHISIYLNDTKLFSYLAAERWIHDLPRQPKIQTPTELAQTKDFLSVVEANLGANKVNYYLDRSYQLETVVGKDGEIQHTLRIGYTNKSPSEAFPGGKYKNRMRIYLPFGSKLTKASWGESDVTRDVTSFVDYGRSGYSMLLELLPKEQKNLVLDYTVPIKLEFKNSLTSYRLDIIKQPGTLEDPLKWSISYPINYQVASKQTQAAGPQEQAISTDLSVDRSFQVDFKK